MCGAVKVLCVAPDDNALTELMRATVAAEWELTSGVTDEADALAVVDAERPHAMVAFGDHGRLVALVREAFPAMRIVTDRDTPGTSAVAASHEVVRDLLRSLARPGGPVRARD
jgi:hypothetical protein